MATADDVINAAKTQYGRIYFDSFTGLPYATGLTTGSPAWIELNNAYQYNKWVQQTGNPLNVSFGDYQRNANSYTANEIMNNRNSGVDRDNPLVYTGADGTNPFTGTPAAPTPAPAPAPAPVAAPSPAPVSNPNGPGSAAPGTVTNGTPYTPAPAPSGNLATPTPKNPVFVPPSGTGGTGGTGGTQSTNPAGGGLFGTNPTQWAGNPWQLGGSFSGSYAPAFIARGIDGWDANDPRAQNPGAASISNPGATPYQYDGIPQIGAGGDNAVIANPTAGFDEQHNQKAAAADTGLFGQSAYTPRSMVDWYGGGITMPHNNLFQQYTQGMMMGAPVNPTFNWAQQPRAQNAPALSFAPMTRGGLFGGNS